MRERIKPAIGDEPEKPNRETVEAMLEAEQISRNLNAKHYSDVEEALKELKR